MKYYYRKYGNRYLKVIVDTYAGTEEDPDEVVDAYWISEEEYNKEATIKEIKGEIK